MIEKQQAKRVESYLPKVNDRMIIITLNTKPVKTHLIQAYFPTSDAPNQDIEDMYGLIEELMEKLASRLS